ncbi:MAG: hypothetical protein BHW64_03410 [Candidatus Melainabacteria bacterium LEY3_CP_29_8]|nr:MAG: hypothetical protein BHW64_03410 [Candidatus Melainabacteria bacterium LEY3_CP_29_8]
MSKAAKNAEESGDNVRAIELYKQAAGIEGLDPSKKVEYLKKALKSLKNGFDALEKNDLSLESTDKKRLFKDLSKQANKLEQQVNNLCQEVNNESIEQLNADIEMLQEKFAEILNKDINSVVLSINNTIEELDSYKKVSDIAKNTLTIINTIFSGYNKAQKLSVKTQGKVYENITETLKQVSEAYQKFAQAQMEPELKLTLLHEAAERFSEKISLNKGIFSRKKTDDVDLKKYQVVTELYTQTAILYHKTAKAAETKESKEKFYCIAIGYLREQICWLDKCKNTTEIDKTTNKILALYQEAIDAGVNKNTMQEFLTEQVSTLNVQLEDSESASDEAWNAQKRLANMQKTDKT